MIGFAAVLPTNILAQQRYCNPGGFLVLQGPMQSRHGWAIAAADFDHDGFKDLMIGAPFDSNGRGLVRLYSVVRNQEIGVVWGSLASGNLGLCVSYVGDVNGDGSAEIAVGVPGVSAVEVHTVMSTGQTSLFQRIQRSADPGFGAAIAAGDVDGDGWPDVVVGSPSSGFGGMVFVYSLASGTPVLLASAAGVTGTGTTDQFGVSVAASDLDGNGVSEVVVGAPGRDHAGLQDSGIANVYRYDGVQRALVLAFFVPPVSANDELGRSVASVADLNGDQRDDIIVSGPRHNSRAGLVRAFGVNALGIPVTIGTVVGTGASEHLGTIVAGLGDVDGDQYGDFAASLPDYSIGGNPVGGVRVFSGASMTEIALLRGCVNLQNVGLTLRYGHAITGVGDVNGDGFGDVAVGAPFADPVSVWGIVEVASLACGNVSTIGPGCQGGGGCTPTLTIRCPCPTPLVDIGIDIRSSPPGNFGGLLLGLPGPPFIIRPGCQFFLSLSIPSVVLPFTLSGAGQCGGLHSIMLQLPFGMSGVIRAQAAVFDSASSDFVWSNGEEVAIR